MKQLARHLLGLAALASFAAAGAQTTLSPAAPSSERERVMLWAKLGPTLLVLPDPNLGVSAPLVNVEGVQNRPQGSAVGTLKSPGTGRKQKVDFDAVQRRLQQLETRRRLALPITGAILLTVFIGSVSLAALLKARSRHRRAEQTDW